MNAIEHLQEFAWKTPRDYGGFSPVGDYVIATTNRDADALTRSNWECIGRDMGAVDWGPSERTRNYPAGKDWEARPAVYTWRAGHWAVGWVEYMMIRADASEDVLTAAGETVCALADYPIYNEDHFTDLEFNEACEFWERSSVADRVDYLQRAGLCIFAARRDTLPDDPAGSLAELLRG